MEYLLSLIICAAHVCEVHTRVYANEDLCLLALENWKFEKNILPTCIPRKTT